MTSGKRIQQEIGTFQVMNDLTLQELRSHTTAYQWIIYIGPEEYEEMTQELTDSLPVLQKWIDNKEVSNFLFLLVFHYLTNSLICQITFNGIKYKIDIFLVCDMKCLVRILGLYEVFKPGCQWKCCWCLCDKNSLANFDIKSWPFRDIEKMFQATEQDINATASCGVQVSLFFLFFLLSISLT
jgi:hypothetical protein